MHYLLQYELVPDYLERRGAYRDAHLTQAWASHAQGHLVLGGVLTERVDRAVLLFDAPDRTAVEEFARTDPYVVNGLVTRWTVREWTTVAGSTAADPVHPASPSDASVAAPSPG